MADAEDLRSGFSVQRSVSFCVVLILLLAGCTQKSSEAGSPFEKTVNPEIVQLTPRKPVRIVLKRTAKGLYTWELRGDDVEGIIDADKRLRRYVFEKSRGEKGQAAPGRLRK